MAQPTKAKLDKLGSRHALIKRDEDKLKDDARKVIAEARAEGIEATEIAERTGWSRAWLYREFKEQMRLDETETPEPTPA